MGSGVVEVSGPAGAAAEMGGRKAESLGTVTALCERRSEDLRALWGAVKHGWSRRGCRGGDCGL